MKTCTVALIALLSFLMTGVHAKIQTGPRETSCIKGGHKHDEDDQDDEAYWRVARFSAKADDDDYNTRVHIHSGKQQQKRHSSLHHEYARVDATTRYENKVHTSTNTKRGRGKARLAAKQDDDESTSIAPTVTGDLVSMGTSCHKHDEAYWRVARFASAKCDDDDYNTRVHIHSKQQQKRHSSLRQVVAKPDDDEETSNRNKIHVATIFHWKTLAAGVPDSSRIVASPFQTKNHSNHHNDYDIEDSKLEEVNETCSFSPATGERMHVSRQDVFSDYITA